MEKRPEVSVIVPVYQVESYLERAVESLLAQTLEELEIILVDDGSTDQSPRICDEYARRFPEKVRVLHQENRGLGLARNAGLDLARGEYVAFVDSFPMNAAGKILKYKMREQAVEMLNLQADNAIETA